MNKTNWQAETDKLINNLDDNRRMLLHACCAPCSSASLEYLTQFFDIDILFYNPNISTKEEFDKRLDELKRFVSSYPFKKQIKIISVDYDHNEFLNSVCGLENALEGGERCVKCFALRLSKTAEKARFHGYDYFATTLTISPLKNADVLNKIGLSLEKIGDITYLPTDLKKKGRYLRSIELSKEYDLYRQDFCGCEFSQKQREKEKQSYCHPERSATKS